MDRTGSPGHPAILFSSHSFSKNAFWPTCNRTKFLCFFLPKHLLLAIELFLCRSLATNTQSLTAKPDPWPPQPNPWPSNTILGYKTRYLATKHQIFGHYTPPNLDDQTRSLDTKPNFLPTKPILGHQTQFLAAKLNPWSPNPIHGHQTQSLATKPNPSPPNSILGHQTQFMATKPDHSPPNPILGHKTHP